MSKQIFRHADGGHYVKVDESNFQMKMDDGRWEPGVLYRAVEQISGRWSYRDKNQFGTTKARWAERFEPLATDAPTDLTI